MNLKVILASASPRRKELLKNLIDDFDIIPSTYEEKIPQGMENEAVAEFFAVQKALDVAKKNKNSFVIGCDTVVIAGNEILGKPKDKADAERMLNLLSGREHKVITGLCIVKDGKSLSLSEETTVKFSALSSDEINWYINTNDPMDKAGAYGIQGLGGRFIEGIKGDYYSVMGLPVNKLYSLIKKICPEIL